ncbi:MAG: hypothetical protein IJI09_01855 [Clostridia bacterium]|nr:hypothetical protein [Clostridia bacterium]
MKKTHWLRNTLIVLIICGLAGTVLAAILFNDENNRTYAVSSIQFAFEGSAEGKAPNGYPFDLSGFSTDEVLDAALEASGLTGIYTADQLRENLTVTGVYPEKIAEQMTKYVSLLDANADNAAAVTDYHPTQYSVVLYNDFDKGIASGKLNELLANLLTAYRAYFAKTYSAGLDQSNPIVDLPDYDYAQQMEAINESVDQQIRYAEEIKELAKDFRLNSKGFGDIVTRYENLQSDIDRLNATITLNAVSKDRTRLQKRYEMEIRELQIQLDSLTEELKQVEAQVNSYDKDGIIYVSANGELNRVGSSASDTYDKLVETRKKISDKIAATNAKITLIQARLDDMTGAAANEKKAGEEEDAAAVEQLNLRERAKLQSDVETKIQTLVTKKDAIESDFAAMLDAYSAQEINERTVSTTAVKYKAPSLISVEFVKKVLKTAGPICAVGFMVCMVLLIRSRRKEEKAA